MVDPVLRELLWRQFGAAIDMLENAIRACPAERWDDTAAKPKFWYLAYHTLFWLDFYLAGAPDDFVPRPPFGFTELDPAGPLPPRTYSKAELLEYLVACRRTCSEVIGGLTEERAAEHVTRRWGTLSFLELILYNMRHVQHHTAQMNLLLRQAIDDAPSWVAQTSLPLSSPELRR